MNQLNKENKISLAFTMFLLVVSLILTIGTAYALWSLNHVQSTTNLVKAGCFEISLGESNAINLENSYPMSDESAQANIEPYNLTITNTCTIDANYVVILNVLTGSTINSNLIKYSVSGANTMNPTILDNGTNSHTLSNGDTNQSVKESFELFHGSVKAGSNVTYGIKLWINEDATNSIFGQTFTGNIMVKSNATTISAKNVLDSELLNIDSGLVSVTEESTDQLATNTSYRYVGNTPHNYVDFNNETWRIIGYFNVENNIDVSSNPNTSTNLYEKRLKIIKDEPLSPASAWNSETTDYTNSSLNSFLNNTYYNSMTNKTMIAPSVVYLGQQTTESLSPKELYKNERSEASNYDNRTEVYVGLPYASDFGYASGMTNKDTNMLSTGLTSWMTTGLTNNIWTSYSTDSLAYIVNGSGNIASSSVTNENYIRPVVYLKKGIELVCDNTSQYACGTANNHYTLRGE